MWHAGDACDFTPLERLHCDLIVMLWRQVRGSGVRLGFRSGLGVNPDPKPNPEPPPPPNPQPKSSPEQDGLSAVDARRWAERAQRLGDAGRAVLVLEALALAAEARGALAHAPGTVPAPILAQAPGVGAGAAEVGGAAGGQAVGVEAVGSREEALALTIRAVGAGAAAVAEPRSGASWMTGSEIDV